MTTLSQPLIINKDDENFSKPEIKSRGCLSRGFWCLVDWILFPAILFLQMGLVISIFGNENVSQTLAGIYLLSFVCFLVCGIQSRIVRRSYCIFTLLQVAAIENPLCAVLLQCLSILIFFASGRVIIQYVTVEIESEDESLEDIDIDVILNVVGLSESEITEADLIC